MVMGSQAVFRRLLEAMANPGRPQNISDYAARFSGGGIWLAPAAVLLDNETGFYWDGKKELGEEMRFVSGAGEVSLDTADFVFLSQDYVSPPSGKPADESGEQENPGSILSRVKPGNLVEPHDSATLFIAVPGEGKIKISLAGPGAPPDGRHILIGEAEAAWIRARNERDWEYPCGVELIFLKSSGSFWALPRKVEVLWPM
jgi:alpha-D-ribose 1-methylphosphonate 5-triphosphate synthase subunit PhnH